MKNKTIELTQQEIHQIIRLLSDRMLYLQNAVIAEDSEAINKTRINTLKAIVDKLLG